MKTQDIKNMGRALQQVQESAKAALAKKLAKASASSEKGKAAVTLPKAPLIFQRRVLKTKAMVLWYLQPLKKLLMLE